MTQPNQYLRKPLLVRAIKWTGENTEDVLNFARKKALSVEHKTDRLHRPDVISITNRTGSVTFLYKGDYLIRTELDDFIAFDDREFEYAFYGFEPNDSVYSLHDEYLDSLDKIVEQAKPFLKEGYIQDLEVAISYIRGWDSNCKDYLWHQDIAIRSISRCLGAVKELTRQLKEAPALERE